MKISGFENVLQIMDFYFSAKTNEHITCYFTALVNDNDSFYETIGKECKIQGEESDCFNKSMADFLFIGLVNKISSYKNINGHFITVVLDGLSKKFDNGYIDARKRRIFQNPEKKYNNILEAMKLSSWQLNDDDKNYSEILVQDDKTDWAFLKDINRKYGWKLFPNPENDTVYIGNFSSNKLNNIEKDLLNDIREEVIFFNGSNYKKIHCSLNKYYKLGETVSINNDSYVVGEVLIKRIKNTYEMSYQFIQYPLMTEVLKCDYILQAKVINNEDPEKKGKCQLEFFEDEDLYCYDDIMKDKPNWIETASFFATKNTGISFLPEKDDIVLVQIKNGKGLIITSVRKESLGDKLEDYNKKYLFFKNDRFLEFNEEEVIYNTKKFRLSMSDKEIVLNWDNKILINLSDGQFFISNNNNVKYEITEKTFKIEANDTIFALEDEVKLKSGKSLQIDGNSKIEMKSSKININGNGGVSIN